MKVSRTLLATTAAALFVTGSLAHAQDEEKTPDEQSAAKVKCEGVNSCSKQSACATATSSCAKQNACARQGFLMLSKAECDAAKAKLEQEDSKKDSES